MSQSLKSERPYSTSNKPLNSEFLSDKARPRHASHAQVIGANIARKNANFDLIV